MKTQGERICQKQRVHGEKKEKSKWGIWGSYRIEKDTIIGQYFQKGTFLGGGWWECMEEKYLIIDRQTILLIYSKSLFKDDEGRYGNESPYETRQRNFVYEYFPADSLPSSDCWLKEEKWIWRHEQDWKDYKEKIKQKKKKAKEKR